MASSKTAQEPMCLLTAEKVKSLTVPGKYPDGGRLFLQVRAQGGENVTKSWLFRYVSPAGQRREMGLGSVKSVGLREARVKAAACREWLEQGMDPLELRQKKKDNSKAAASQGSAHTKKPGIQAARSRRKRLDILDATLECLSLHPYPEVTIDAVAKHAGISKGGIQYHFRSRYELLRGAIDRLFQRRLEAYRKDLETVPAGMLTTDHVIETHWKHLTEPEFLIYQELVVASRSDDRLRQLLVDRYREFRKAWSRVSLEVYGWNGDDEEVHILGNIAQYLMDGMAYGWLVDQLAEQDVHHLLSFVKGIMREGVALSESRSFRI